MHALWRADSKELFFVEPDTRKLMAVDIATVDGRLVPGIPKSLFTIRGDTGDETVNWFAVSRNRDRFLVASSPPESIAARPLNVIVNWLNSARSTSEK
jgi:hypothetical protein